MLPLDSIIASNAFKPSPLTCSRLVIGLIGALVSLPFRVVIKKPGLDRTPPAKMVFKKWGGVPDAASSIQS